MKKLGFTLSELLAALAIIGVVSAITTPMVSGILPDKNKVNVLRVYKLVNDLNRDMLSNNGLYFQSGEVDEDGDPINQCIGIACQEQPVDPNFSDLAGANGDSKYAILLSRHLEMVPPHEGVYGLRGQFFMFETVDGILWGVRGPRVNNDPGNAGSESNPLDHSYQLMVDFDRKPNSPNCSFDEARCDKPDRFLFEVNTRGYLTGSDPLTRAYLSNPHKLNDKKKDFAEAKRLRGN